MTLKVNGNLQGISVTAEYTGKLQNGKITGTVKLSGFSNGTFTGTKHIPHK